MPRAAIPSANGHRLPGIDSFINREIGQRYLVREFLGEGAHARVYRATDAVRQADVALKIFSQNALDAQVAEAARQFEVREGNAILPLLEVHPEYLEGEVTVMPLMRRTLGDLDAIFASQAIYYTRRILTALEFCHGRDVIHGDVKPKNVFIDDREAAFLGDFGVRDFLPDGARGHTLEYASPELLAGAARSQASDTWAAAVTLYELLTGELPFGSRADDTDDVVAARIANAEYKPPDQVRPYLPLRVRNFFRACLTPRLEERPVTTVEAMRRALSDLDIRAEWIQWRRQSYLSHWEGFQVAAGRRTGVRYEATVRERPRLGCWEAEIKRAQPDGGFRRWPGIASFQGTQREALYRMVLWMRNITTGGRP
jgi:serine/threonine protein kinase